jgi:hypothetical protein
MTLMPRSLTVLLLLLLCATSRGNPLILTHPAYMSSERLAVKVRDDAAEIDGRFHFRSLAASLKQHPGVGSEVGLSVSIWVPRDPKEADTATAALLRQCEDDSHDLLNDENRALWDAAIGLKITVGRRPVKIERFSIGKPDWLGRRAPPRDPWSRKGFCCITVTAYFPPAWLAGDPEIRVQYRQGLRRTGHRSEFHYVPEFWQMPKDRTTRDLSQYAMHLSNGSSQNGSLGSASVPAGYSLVLPLAHHQPITFTLEAARGVDGR